MDVFPKYELRNLSEVNPGTVCARFRSGGLAIGLVVNDGRSWIRFSKGEQDEAWTVLTLDHATREPVLVFERARLVVSFEPNTLDAGGCTDAKLAGSAFLMEGKIAISGLVRAEAMAFYVEDGSLARSNHPSLPYFTSWSIEIPDGAMWRNIFSRSREA
jgi:hypothetical protein